MTDTPANQSRQNNELLGKLAELDIGALTQVAEDPELANELMADLVSSGRIAETAILALETNSEFAEQLRQVFKLDYLTLRSINHRIGIELEAVVWHMFENNLEGIQKLLTDWMVPSDTMKDFTLGYFFRSKKAPNPVIWARAMEVTGLSGADIQGYCDEQFRRAVRDGLIKDTGSRVTSALIAKVNRGGRAETGLQDRPTITAQPADA